MENGNENGKASTQTEVGVKHGKAKAGGSSDEKAPDSSDNGTPKSKGSWEKINKGKKRKKPKDSTAPRQPLTGYVRFLNDRREAVRASNPSLSFSEITKVLANEWSNLTVEKKQQYLNAAEQDKERYTKELNAYKQTEAYKLFTQAQTEKKLKESKEENSSKVNPVIPKDEPRCERDTDITNFDIPIFTEEFLDHNKARESELRQLRKSNTDCEQQNAALEKHIENMRSVIEKLEAETLQQRNNNVALQQHLDNLRSTLTKGFANLRLPGTKEVPTLQTIDNYMNNLHVVLMENSNHSFLETVRDIIGKLEFQG